MKFLKVLAPLVAAVLWGYGLHHSFEVSGNALPPLGSFFSPSVGFWKNAQEPDPGLQTEISGLPVEGHVIFDDRMVPHIFAPDLHHACFIQGYVHAMHRLWQMDFATRAAEGRISEIIGAKAVDFDRTKRRKGLAMSAKASIEAWKKHPEAYALAQAYADGINAYIRQLTDAELPIEFKLMDYKPEPWSPYRSALFHKSMAEILCGRDMDIEMTNAKKFFGEEFAYFFNEIDSLTDPVIPRGTVWNFEREKTDPAIVPDSSMGYIDWVREPGSSGIGSNNWAVSGSKSATGNPILCNDPHLMLTLPSVWYEQQIQTPEMNVYGVTFAGIPGVVIGFNQDISWGVTNAGWDVLDWYQIKWKDESKTAYAYGDGWQETEKRVERIRVKDAADVIDTILMTKWGPVVFDDPRHKKNGLAMHWIISDRFENVELKTFMELNQGRNIEDYKKAIRHFPYPAQNFAFASTNGDIGITVQGRMPVKSDQQGRFVLDGSNPDHAWKGFIDETSNPQIVNPSRGFISSANQRSTDLSYPNYYNNGDFRDYRGTLINRLLAAKDKWSVQDMKALQYNAYSLRAETALPALLQAMDASGLDGEGRSILEQLQNWDYQYASDRMEPAYFEWWFQYFHKMVWDELLLDSTLRAVGVPSDQSTIAFLKQKPLHRYFDQLATPQKEDAKALVQMAFDSVLIFRRQHPEVKSWTDYKDASISHIARIPAFSRTKINAPGTKDVINAHGRTEGPSWRMIVELDKNKIDAYGIYPGGQSGNPGSPYYDQMIDDWSKGKYYKLHFMSSPEDLPNPAFTMQFQKSK